MRRVLACSVLMAVLAACSDSAEQADHQAEWRKVLEHKKTATSARASAEQKQMYADSLAAFVQRHPGHGRGREVYQLVQVEFADELSAFGRYQDAVRIYRAVLAHDPQHQGARRGLGMALDRLAVTREKLLRLEKGMTRRQVANVLGKPIPGWTVTTERRSGTDIEAWYYRTTTGSVAGVYFREGKVFAAEENSDAKLGL